MMDRIVSHIIANVSKDNTCNEKSSKVSWDEEGQDVEQRCKGDDKENWRIHKTIGVHWDCVMDSVDDKVKPDPVTIFRDLELKVEAISVKSVFKKGPA